MLLINLILLQHCPHIVALELVMSLMSVSLLSLEGYGSCENYISKSVHADVTKQSKTSLSMHTHPENEREELKQHI